MKTYNQFKEDLQEAVPLAIMAAPMLPKILGGAAALAGGLGLVHQATRQGQGGRSQPVDYGQGGTATPRTPNVQRGRLSSNDAYNRAKEAEKKAARREEQQRARERKASESGSTSELGQKADEVLQGIRDAEYATQRRENPELLKKEAQTRQQRIKAERKRQRQAAMRERMNKAADRLGLD